MADGFQEIQPANIAKPDFGSLDARYLTDFSVPGAEQALREQYPIGNSDEAKQKRNADAASELEEAFRAALASPLSELSSEDRALVDAAGVWMAEEGKIEGTTLEEDRYYLRAHGWGGTVEQFKARGETGGRYRESVRKLRNAVRELEKEKRANSSHTEPTS